MSKAEAAVNCNGNDLIVDFVDRMHMDTATDSKQQVSFSEDITIHSFQYPSREEVSRRWDSKRDKSLYAQDMARDIRSIRFLLSITPMEE
jgi:hypothetical protein